MSTQSLTANTRSLFGRKVKRLRSNGILPANIYAKNAESIAIEINADTFSTVFDAAGETGIIQISIDGVDHPVLVSEVSTHPLTGDILHVDFREVNMKEKITATIPVELIGESIAEKNGIGIIVQQLDEVEVEALPLNLPEKFVLDISGIKTLEDAFHVSDLHVDTSKVEMITDPDLIVVNITEIREEEETQELTPDDVEVTEEKADSEEEQESNETSSEE